MQFRRSLPGIRSGICFLLVVIGMAFPAAAEAASLAKPSGPVILTVTGAITETNAPGRAEFDSAMLDALGIDKVTTTTNWTSGPQQFEGVKLSKVLDAVGAQGTTIFARALNDYTGKIAVADVRTYPVLLASRVNGQPLAADKGPLWIIYPQDDYPALRERDDLLWAWQLASIDIR